MLYFLTFFFFFFFNDTATTEIYTLSLHDALPIWGRAGRDAVSDRPSDFAEAVLRSSAAWRSAVSMSASPSMRASSRVRRSEEHTSELQSPCNLVCRLLLEKKKKNRSYNVTQDMTV